MHHTARMSKLHRTTELQEEVHQRKRANPLHGCSIVPGEALQQVAQCPTRHLTHRVVEATVLQPAEVEQVVLVPRQP